MMGHSDAFGGPCYILSKWPRLVSDFVVHLPHREPLQHGKLLLVEATGLRGGYLLTEAFMKCLLPVFA